MRHRDPSKTLREDFSRHTGIKAEIPLPDYSRFFFFRLFHDPISEKIAAINTSVRHQFQSPKNQLLTALYQSRVIGKKMKPRIGQMRVSNTPKNQLFQSHRMIISILGAIGARIARNIGIFIF